MTQAKVLIVEDSASLALGYAAQLQDAGHEVSLCETLAKAPQEVKAQCQSLARCPGAWLKSSSPLHFASHRARSRNRSTHS